MSGTLIERRVLEEDYIAYDFVIKHAAEYIQDTESTELSRYLEIRFLLPAYNMCDQFFRIAGHAMSNSQNSIQPSNIKMQLLLYMNREFWSIDDVMLVIKK